MSVTFHSMRLAESYRGGGERGPQRLVVPCNLSNPHFVELVAFRVGVLGIARLHRVLVRSTVPTF